MARFLVVEPAHSGSNHRLNTCEHTFLIYLRTSGAIISLILHACQLQDICVTSPISRSVAQSLEGADRGRVSMCAFVWVSVRVCM